MSFKTLSLLISVVALGLFGFSQSSGQATTEQLVLEWFSALNALDGTDQAFTRFVDLYQPDALQQVGPAKNQYGPVYFQDQRQINKWIRDFFATHAPIPETAYFSVRIQTVNEKTAGVIYDTETAWGDSGGAVEFTARYIEPSTGKGFMLSGSAFFQFRGGKIIRLRLYMPGEEIMEITPPLRT